MVRELIHGNVLMCFYKHIMHSMNWIFDDLIISIIFDIILQLWLLTFDAYLITGHISIVAIHATPIL
jgi:hypothetical protein